MFEKVNPSHPELTRRQLPAASGEEDITEGGDNQGGNQGGGTTGGELEG